MLDRVKVQICSRSLREKCAGFRALLSGHWSPMTEIAQV